MPEHSQRHARGVMVEAGAHPREGEEAVVGLSTTATEEEWGLQLLEEGGEGEGALGVSAMEVAEEPRSQVETEAHASLLELQRKEGVAPESVVVVAAAAAAAHLTKKAEAEQVLRWTVGVVEGAQWVRDAGLASGAEKAVRSAALARWGFSEAGEVDPRCLEGRHAYLELLSSAAARA